MNNAVAPLSFPPEMKHLPLVFLGVLVVNAVILRARYTQLAAARPELAQSYRRFFVVLLCGMGLPWVIMAIGLESGQVPNFFALFHPREGNPFVLVFYVVVGVLILLFEGWIFLGQGAEFIVNHPGILRGNSSSVAGIRLWAAGAGLGGCIGIVLRFLDIPRSPF